MAKGKRKGRRRTRRKGKKKGGSKARKHSVMVEYGGLYDAAKVLLSPVGDQTVAHRLIASVYDPAQRKIMISELKTPGSQLRTTMRNETKEVQIGVGLEVGRQFAPTRKLIGKADRVVGKFLGKRYKA